jgi:predicted O-linked N-acetylglucosamine transferase (SPINDLY family)
MLADVVLDTPHFSGGKNSIDCLAFGIPIVTWSGRLMRGMLTLAYYKQMGVTDCVASDAESYVDIALRLANDKNWRNENKEKILSHADVLNEDIEAVRELERFFEWAVKEKSKRTAEPYCSS